MYLIVRDTDGQVQKVYGYIPIKKVKEYVDTNNPNMTSKWEMSVPIEYTGEVTYLPEKKLSVSDLPKYNHNV